MHDDFDKLAPWAVATARFWCIKNRIRSDLIPDITQEALVACWLALRRHDPKKSTVKTFCQIRIKGAMKDYLRSQIPKGYKGRFVRGGVAAVPKGWQDRRSMENIEHHDHGRDNPGIAAADLRDWLDHAKLKLQGKELIVWSLMANDLSIRQIVASSGIGTDNVFKIKRAIKERAIRG